jgi:UDP-glucose 6-dehydrogenase
MKTKVGFIGQGWIGKNYADDFDHRGYESIRYSLEEPYVHNKAEIKNCRITLIAVPTPTTPRGFDDSFLRSALENIGESNIAVIKSTLLPGTTKKLQADFPDFFILHSPEFLAEKTAAHDAAHPNRNLIGIPANTVQYTKIANEVMDVLPDAPYKHVLDSTDAEFVKYAGNCFLYSKVIFMNVLYDMVAAMEGDWNRVRDALIHDPRIGISHTEPVHTSGHATVQRKTQRGAGGHCFIKDFEAMRQFYKELLGEDKAFSVLTAQAKYNNHLLRTSGKDLDLLSGVYGEDGL